MSFVPRNHPQQTGRRGPLEKVDDRGTDPALFAVLDARFHFTLDVAAAPHNAKCPRYFTRADDGLAQSWAGERVFCNPPFSDIRPWVAKAWTERRCPLIVMLLPANRTEQRWWQDLVESYRDNGKSPLRVEFLRGRIGFERPDAAPKSAKWNRVGQVPFGLCLLIWSGAYRVIMPPPDQLALPQRLPIGSTGASSAHSSPGNTRRSGGRDPDRPTSPLPTTSHGGGSSIFSASPEG